MSCTCNHKTNEDFFNCPCDRFVHPQPLRIGAGLTDLPRQLAGFPEFRRALLFAVRDKPALKDWRARQPDDLGVMLLEMWAYVCDVLSFYDKVIAQEGYLRTAVRRSSLRRLVALLGYLPRPAVASLVYLTAMAEGRRLVILPEGTAFQSGGLEDSPPQLFELDRPTLIHPLTNRWNIKPPSGDFTATASPGTLLILPRMELKTSHPLLLVDSVNQSLTQGAWLLSAEPYAGKDGKRYRKLKFAGATTFPANYPLARLHALEPSQSAPLWTVKLPSTPSAPATPATISSTGSNSTVVLSGLFSQLKAGEFILISRQTEVRWFRISKVEEDTRLQSAGNPVVINGTSFTMPGISVPVTRLTLDVDINDNSRKRGTAPKWTEAEISELVVYFAIQPAGTLAGEAKTTLSAGDALYLEGDVEEQLENHHPSLFVLQDKNLQAVKFGGRVDYGQKELTPDQAVDWQESLTLPVQAFGNVLKATRGETALNEILGSGDAALPNQSFKLKKKPLTYLPAPTAANDSGVQNTLRVYVNGIRWTEVPGFYNRKPEEEIYIVRQNDEGDSMVTFGDGIRGRRVPTGTDNVVATYRFGAGAAAPPAGSISQIARPVKNLVSVNNPLPAGGGADAEGAEGLRRYAPWSVLILGRAVSLPDMEAVTAAVAGVRSVQVEWRWNKNRQAPVVQVWYIGDAGIGTLVTQRLQAVTDPTVPIAVDRAEAVRVLLQLDIQTDARYLQEKVLDDLRRHLTNTENGLLAPENISIGKPLFRSRLFAAAAFVPGVLSVRNILWNNGPFALFAQTPGAGRYFDFEQGELHLNGNK